MGVSFGEPEPEPQVPYYAANFGYQHLVPPQVDLANAQVKFVWLSSFQNRDVNNNEKNQNQRWLLSGKLMFEEKSLEFSVILENRVNSNLRCKELLSLFLM